MEALNMLPKWKGGTSLTTKNEWHHLDDVQQPLRVRRNEIAKYTGYD